MSIDDIPQTRNIINVLSFHKKDDNFTELHLAIKENRALTIENLLGNNALLNAQTLNGVTSLLLACTLSATTDQAKSLIQQGADVNLPDNVSFSPLLAACKTQKLDIVQLLLDNGANINHQDDCDYTALHYAIENDNLELVDILLTSGADTSLVDCNGWNPLMMALHDHEACASKILPFTSDLNAIAFNGWSALMLAAANMSKDIVVKLVKRCADVNINVDGNMPVTLALERRDPTIFDYLWNLTDVGILEEEGEMQGFLEAMLTSDWVTSQKVQYLYKVLDTPGVDLFCSGYIRMLAHYMVDIENAEDFFAIDVYGIMDKLFEKNAQLNDLDIEGFISMSARYDIEYKQKLLQLLLKNNADLNNFHYIYMSIVNDPDLTLTLLPYCFTDDLDNIFKCIITVRRLDIQMLKLIKNILKLYTPSSSCREAAIRHLECLYVCGVDCFCYAILVSTIEFPYKKYIKHDLTPQEKVIFPELYKEVLELLSEQRLPSLKEISRDFIRQRLQNSSQTTPRLLNNLKKLHLPQFMIDIICCKSAVNFFD